MTNDKSEYPMEDHLSRVSIAKRYLGRMLVDLPDFIDRKVFLDVLTDLGMWEQRLTRMRHDAMNEHKAPEEPAE